MILFALETPLPLGSLTGTLTIDKVIQLKPMAQNRKNKSNR